MEKLSKTLLLVVTVLYAVGLVAQNVVLATVGASDLALLQARGVFLGIWVVIIFIAICALPAATLAPWILSGQGGERRVVIRRSAIVLVALTLPSLLFWIVMQEWYRKNNVIDFDGAWFLTWHVAVPAALTLVAGLFLFREVRADARRWQRLIGLAIIALSMAILYVVEASFQVVMMIPSEYLGAKARYVRLVTKADVKDSLVAAGVQYVSNSQYVTQTVQVTDESDSEVVIVLSLWNGGQQYFTSMVVKKSDLMGIISEPTQGDGALKKAWSSSAVWPPPVPGTRPAPSTVPQSQPSPPSPAHQ